jgi:periplasmic protein TonB
MSSSHRSFTGGSKARIAALAIVAVGHAGLLAALAQAGFSRGGQQEHAPLQVALLAEPEEEQMLPPPPRLDFEPPRVELIPPDITIEWEQAATNAITVSTAPAPVSPTVSAQPLLVTEVEYVRPPRPAYPPAARKRRQEGLVVLKVLVDVIGRPALVEVQESSGYPLLDTAARDAVRATQFRPHIENGVARAVLVLIPIEFGLRDRLASNSAD